VTTLENQACSSLGIDFNANHQVFLITDSDCTWLLYAPTLTRLFRISNRLADELKQCGFSGASPTASLTRLKSTLTAALAKAVTPFPLHLGKSRFFHLALGLTKNCPLKCIYCHAEAGGPETMNREILDSAIAYAFENAIRCGRKGVNVSFAVGGEPTSQWELFKYCVDALNRAKQQNQLQLLLSMTTNGYYGDEKRDFIVKNVKNILLSLDGPPEFQNTQRPTQAGNASFPIVMATAKYFAREQSSLSIRVTVSNRSVSRLEDMVYFFHDELGTKLNIVFEPLVPIGRAQHPMGGIEPPKLQDFVDNFIRAKERGCQYGIKVTTSSANIKRLVTGFCGAMTIPSFTVTTTGKVTTCERDSDGTAYCYENMFPIPINSFLTKEE
jgi:sulfatase maturation enzyme AslB (radical SAM superfamily)